MSHRFLFSFPKAIIWRVYRTGTAGSSLYTIERNKFKQEGALNIAVVCALAKLRKATTSFVMSISPHGTTRLQMKEIAIKFDI
jgi:hypothetical protein